MYRGFVVVLGWLFIKLHRVGLVLYSWTWTRWDILQWAATACLCSYHFIADIYSEGCVCMVLLSACDACYLTSSKVYAAHWLLAENAHPAMMSSLFTPQMNTLCTGLTEKVLYAFAVAISRRVIGNAQLSWHWRWWDTSSNNVNWESSFTVPFYQKKKLFIPFGL